MTRAGEPSDSTLSRLLERSWALALVPVVVTLVAFAGSLSYGFLGDAKFLIEDNAHLNDWNQLGAQLTSDYFYSSSGNSIPYYRPFTKLSWFLEAQVWDSPFGFHATQLFWHLLTVAGIVGLGRSLGLLPWTAALAAALYGVHPAMAEPVSLVMARSDVVSCCGVVWSLAAWARWREGQGGARRSWFALHLVALFIAVTSKEVAVILPVLVCVWAFLTQASLRSSLPAWGLVGAFLVARWGVLGGGTALEFDPLRIFVSLGTYLRGALPLSFESSVQSLSLVQARDVVTLLAASAAWGLAVLGGVAAFRRRAVAPLLLLSWALLAVTPVVLVEQMNVPGVSDKYPLADRWVIQSVAAGALLIGWGLSRIPVVRWRIVAGAATTVWCCILAFTTSSSHAFYESEESLLRLEQRRFEATPERFRTAEDHCRAGDREIVESLMLRTNPRQVLSLLEQVSRKCGAKPERDFNLLSVYSQIEDWPSAKRVGARLLRSTSADQRSMPLTHYLYGVALLRTGEPRGAAEHLALAKKLGVEDCELLIRHAEALSHSSPVDSAARLVEAHGCQEKSGAPPNVGLLEAAATLYEQAGKTQEAEAIRRRTRGKN